MSKTSMKLQVMSLPPPSLNDFLLYGAAHVACWQKCTPVVPSTKSFQSVIVRAEVRSQCKHLSRPRRGQTPESRVPEVANSLAYTWIPLSVSLPHDSARRCSFFSLALFFPGLRFHPRQFARLRPTTEVDSARVAITRINRERERRDCYDTQIAEIFLTKGLASTAFLFTQEDLDGERLRTDSSHFIMQWNRYVFSVF